MKNPPLASLYDLARLTKAKIIPGSAPEPQVTGICAFFPAFHSGDMLVHRGDRPDGYLSNNAVALAITKGGSAIITESPSSLGEIAGTVPVLHVENIRQAVIAMGHHAREQFQGKVIGVTGTAGKTSTVGIITQVLSSYGESYGTTHSSNGPTGIAWTLCRPPSTANYCTLEISIQQMQKNSALARPHIAVITNIGPAHLQGFKDVASVAKSKSLIFSSMAPGSTAVINADMEHLPIFMEAATARSLNVILYGESAEADIRLIRYENRHVEAMVDGRVWQFRLATQGKHFAANALAAMGVVKALGLNLSCALQALEHFTPSDGRGEELRLPFMGGRLTLRNDAYNANPLSMAAGLTTMGQVDAPTQSKVVVLGDMLELGPDAAAFHRELYAQLQKLDADRLLLCGPLMRSLWTEVLAEGLPRVRVCEWVENLDDAKAVLKHWVQSDDYLMIKGSRGTGLYTLVQWLRTSSEQPLPSASAMG